MYKCMVTTRSCQNRILMAVQENYEAISGQHIIFKMIGFVFYLFVFCFEGNIIITPPWIGLNGKPKVCLRMLL